MIEVVLRWSGDVVEVTHVDGKLTVGRRVDDDLFVPLECVESVALVEKTADGFMLQVPRGMRGFIARGRRERVDVAPEGVTVAIDDDTRAHLSSGPFTIEVRRARRSRLPLLAPIFDAMWANTATLTLASMGILVAIFSLGTAHDDDSITPVTRTTIAHLTITPKTTAPTRTASSTTTKSTTSPRTQTHAERRVRSTVLTHTMRSQLDDRKVVDSKIAALFAGSGIDSLVGGDNFAETAAAIGSIDARKTASTSNEGLAARSDGEGPWASTMHIGLVATERPIADGPGSFGLHHDHGVPEVHVDDVDYVDGTLDPELIKRVVREHVAQVRYCYERALITHPGLEEKIVATWAIGADGHVRRTSSDVDDNVASCVRAKIGSWVFPKPKGGGDVVVRYPFVLRPAH